MGILVRNWLAWLGRRLARRPLDEASIRLAVGRVPGVGAVESVTGAGRLTVTVRAASEADAHFVADLVGEALRAHLPGCEVCVVVRGGEGE